jgi:hypothetical protein
VHLDINTYHASVTEVIVAPDDAGEHDYSDEAAHAAAVAEGASEVHGEQAAEAAGEAQAAAEVALAAAQANIESVANAEEAAATAVAAADQAGVTLDMVHEALLAQGSAITALTEELHAGRQQQQAPRAKRSKPTPDKEPGSSRTGPRWVRR